MILRAGIIGGYWFTMELFNEVKDFSKSIA